MENEANKQLNIVSEHNSDDDDEDIDYNPQHDNVSTDKSDNDSDSEIDEQNRYELKTSDKANNDSQSRVVSDCYQQKLLTDEQQKERTNSLWTQFRDDVTDVTDVTPQHESNVSDINRSKVMITKTYDFAGQAVKVTEESEELNAKCSTTDSIIDKNVSNVSKSVKRSAGLAGVLDKLKKPKMSTLTKSMYDWSQFKKEEGIEEELTQHNKSKEAYVERQAFLQRTDLRQFEIEKNIRSRKRAQQQISKN